MQYYNLSARVERKPTTLRILAIINAVLFIGFFYLLVLPFID